MHKSVQSAEVSVANEELTAVTIVTMVLRKHFISLMCCPELYGPSQNLSLA